MKRAVYIIPGYRHLPQNKAYKQIAKILKKQGFSPKPISLYWKKKTISQNADYFLKKFKKKISKNYILGFSYGAMIAFIASTKVKVAGLILCSLSPYFKEDFLKEKKPKFEEFVNLRSKTLAKKIKAKKVLMLYGKNEDKTLKNRVLEVFSDIKNQHKYLMPIENTDHDIGNKKYLEKIFQAALQLS